MLKFASLMALLFVPALAKAQAPLDRIVAVQQAQLNKQQAQIEALQPVYLSDLNFTLLNEHSSKKDGVGWSKEPGFKLSDGNFYSKGVQLHPLSNSKVTLEVAVPRGHPIFSVILADIPPVNPNGDYIYRFYSRKGTNAPTLIGTFGKTPNSRKEFGLGDADTLIVEIDANGSNDTDHSALVDAKFIR